jgi:hypothetical protein
LKRRKDIISQFRKNPSEKISSVVKVATEIVDKQELDDWGISIQTVPHVFETRMLDRPKILNSETNKATEILDKSSYSMPYLEPMTLKKQKWAIIYDADDYDDANMLFECFILAGNKYGVQVEEPIWLEIPS